MTGRRELSLVSPQQELSIGSEGYKAVVAEYGLYDDPALQAYVNEVGQKVARGLAPARPGLALHRARRPDGERLRHAGRLHLRHARHPGAPELRGAAGRRAGPRDRPRHPPPQRAEQHHPAAALRAGAGRGLDRLEDGARSTATWRSRGCRCSSSSTAATTSARPTSWAVSYAAAAGYDPREIPSTYAMLKRVERAGPAQRLPGFLSTHPDPGDREVNTTAALAQQAIQGKSEPRRERARLRAAPGRPRLRRGPAAGLLRRRRALPPGAALPDDAARPAGSTRTRARRWPRRSRGRRR